MTANQILTPHNDSLRGKYPQLRGVYKTLRWRLRRWAVTAIYGAHTFRLEEDAK